MSTLADLISEMVKNGERQYGRPEGAAPGLPRVIVQVRAAEGRTPYYAAGYVEGYGGADIILRMPSGTHVFSRADGTWLSGDCTNYKDGVILDFAEVEASIKGGFGGDVEAQRRAVADTLCLYCGHPPNSCTCQQSHP